MSSFVVLHDRISFPISGNFFTKKENYFASFRLVT